MSHAKRKHDRAPFCVPLRQATARDRVGGKAMNLARAQTLGCRVPETVVVTRDAMTLVLHANGLEARVAEYLVSSATEASAQLDARYRVLSRALRECAIPAALEGELRHATEGLLARSPFGLAIRSSATFEDSENASFAGVFESYLGIRSAEQVLARILDCWCNAWSPRAVRYLARLEIQPRVDPMAVMIQAVVPAKCSGVMYTANPRTGNPWEFVMEATHGLSIDLMSGTGAGDSYLLAWDTGAILEREIGTKPVLWQSSPKGVERREILAAEEKRSAVTDDEVREVIELARKLDEGFAGRMDVEWAISPAGLWLVQARPLTALPEFFPVTLDLEDCKKEWQRAAWVLPLWSDHPPNFLTPLYRDMSESDHWFRYQPDDIVLTGIWREERDVHGYRYTDAPAQQTFFDFFADPSQFEGWLGQNEHRYRTRWDDRHRELERLVATAATAMRDTQTAKELVPAMRRVRDHIWDLASFGWSGPQALGWMCESLLEHLGKTIDPNFRVDAMISGGADSHTFTVTRALQELGRSIDEANVRETLSRYRLDEVIPRLLEDAPDCQFLKSYESLRWQLGKTPVSWRHRPPFWRLCEGDAAALHTIRAAMRGEARDVVAIRNESRQARERTEADFRSRVRSRAPDLLPRFEQAVSWARYWTQALNDRHGLVVGLLWERELIWEVGRRLHVDGVLDAPEDVLLLPIEDLETSAGGSSFREIVVARKLDFQRTRRLTPPRTIGADPERVGPTSAIVAADDLDEREDVSLQGTGFSNGVATGRARIVQDLTDPDLLDSLSPLDILVLPFADAFAYADWHSLLMVVTGVISPGRPGHHLCQVARECGVPVIGHVKRALDRICEGEILDIDAGSGRIRPHR